MTTHHARSSTKRRPRLLDLFCCAGGAAKGYFDAGFEVVGLDVAEEPNYPFEFHRGDALEFLAAHGQEFDAIHASPPCQASCTLTAGTNQGREYPQLIPVTRTALARVGVPTVIENVQGAKLRRDITLCGEMFGLSVIRHRYFELSGWTMPQPEHLPHRSRAAGYRHGRLYDGPYVGVYGNGGGKGTVVQWQTAMGIDWTDDRAELAEAIPPAYTHHLGRALIEIMTGRTHEYAEISTAVDRWPDGHQNAHWFRNKCRLDAQRMHTSRDLESIVRTRTLTTCPQCWRFGPPRRHL